MKKVLLLVCLVFAKQYIYSQNVGVGTVSPAHKLDVKGDINTDSVYRIGSATILSARGLFNVFVGASSGAVITTGAGNTALGAQSLYFNTTGSYNTASGYQAMSNNTTGTMNTASGWGSLYNNISGSRNSAFGTLALSGNIASDNTAMGFYALRDNATGEFNTAVGGSSMLNNTMGSLNTATGSYALYANTSGGGNTATGVHALTGNTIGQNNCAFGTYGLYHNASGSYNTSVGYSASFNNVDGSFNTAIGAGATASTTAANYNTALGYHAGDSYNLGWNNTIVGADADLSFAGQYNSIAIGNLATCPDNSTVRIGNSANWSYGAYANWTNISDERYKTNVKENVAGLDFILRLRPVTYQMNVTALSKKLSEGDGKELNETMKLAIAEKEKIVWTGFMAQEVETAAKETAFDFSGVDKPRNEHGVYGLRYAEFVVPLVKAVQEQQGIIVNQNEKIKQLQLSVDLLLKEMEKMKSTDSPKN